MIIGVPKEIKNNEFRVALRPAGAKMLGDAGHTVIVQKSAGEGSDFPDEAYIEAGAVIVETAAEVFGRAEMILKVKEPQPAEYPLIRAGQVLFTYFHFSASEELTRAMMNTGATCIAYETVEARDRSLPLLTPMSEVAGRMAVQEGARWLTKAAGGRGVLLGGVPGVEPASVMVIGGGVVGVNAAKMAAGLGAQVTLLDISPARLRELADIMPANVITVISNEYTIAKFLKRSELVVGAVLLPGARAPKIIKRDHLKTMMRGSVIVDVAVDQGGICETTRATTHADPVYEVDGVIHYCVANMPGAVARTSTKALTNATLPYVMRLADGGMRKAFAADPGLLKGLNVIDGKVVYEPVAEAFDLPFTPASQVLGQL